MICPSLSIFYYRMAQTFFSDTVNDQKAVTLAGNLTKLFAASHTSSSGIKINMKNSRCRTYQNQGSSTGYRKACRDEKTRD